MSNTQPPNIPQQTQFKSNQFEFTEEQNRTMSGLSDAMKSFANLMLILALVFGVLALLSGFMAANDKGSYGFPIGLGAATLLTGAFGFLTGNSSKSFRKVAETKNEDIWHVMNALGSLKGMFGLLRILTIGTLVLMVIAGAIVAFGMFSKS
jgi:hypothetical protein